jgi:hypothetical protein
VFLSEGNRRCPGSQINNSVSFVVGNPAFTILSVLSASVVHSSGVRRGEEGAGPGSRIAGSRLDAWRRESDAMTARLVRVLLFVPLTATLSADEPVPPVEAAFKYLTSQEAVEKMTHPEG